MPLILIPLAYGFFGTIGAALGLVAVGGVASMFTSKKEEVSEKVEEPTIH
jgi:hypothetical protein